MTQSFACGVRQAEGIIRVASTASVQGSSVRGCVSATTVNLQQGKVLVLVPEGNLIGERVCVLKEKKGW